VSPLPAIEGTYQSTQVLGGNGSNYYGVYGTFENWSSSYFKEGGTLTMKIDYVTDDSVKVNIYPTKPVTDYITLTQEAFFKPVSIKAFVEEKDVDSPQRRRFIYLSNQTPRSELHNGISIFGNPATIEYYYALPANTKDRIVVKFASVF
jgi:hypothetical protein